MSETNNGGRNAYPINYPGADPRIYQGLSTRELFAAMAMEGHCANPLMSDLAIEKIAEVSVEQADALLKALEETK